MTTPANRLRSVLFPLPLGPPMNTLVYIQNKRGAVAPGILQLADIDDVFSRNCSI
jgi:hypothetical protein